jgi:Neuraminidase (sialidase)
MPAIEVHEIKKISSNQTYHGWPTVTRRRNGELLVAVSAGRVRHVCPFGQVHLLRSSDSGKTWTQKMIVNTPLDDRDAGILETARGTLVLNWFTSIAWMVRLERAERDGREACAAMGDAFVSQCQKIRALLDEKTIDREIGPWIIRSEDGGQTWSEKINPQVGSPHGPIELTDGRLLYVGNAKRTKENEKGSPYDPYLAVSESTDDAKTWRVIARLPVRSNDNTVYDCEPHMVQAANGRLIVFIRNHSARDKGMLLQCESDDGGKTWTEPYANGVWGFPAHLLRLRDGRLLATYGYRSDPYGNRVVTSDDHGKTWGRPMTLSAEETHRDIGYPSSVEMDDGSMISVWYEAVPNESTPGMMMGVVRMARWSWVK